jgi:hypothetical protein
MSADPVFLLIMGWISLLRRYPVKSMLGEDVEASEVTGRGLTGDRGLALVHRETGKVASAKNPRIWRDLLRLAATALEPTALEPTALAGAVRITFPDGKTASSTDAGIDDLLSDFLQQPVTLTATPPQAASLERAVPEEVLRAGVTAEVEVRHGQLREGTFFDFAPLHLLTTSTLDRIAALHPRGTADLVRYRPNIVIRTEAEGFTENDWLDRDLSIGDDLVVRVVVRTPRCAIPTLAHGDLPRDSAALRVLADHNRVPPAEGSTGTEPCAGVYAQVVRPGRIGQGDLVRYA